MTSALSTLFFVLAVIEVGLAISGRLDPVTAVFAVSLALFFAGVLHGISVIQREVILLRSRMTWPVRRQEQDLLNDAGVDVPRLPAEADSADTLVVDAR
jgi:hypothetical protein